MVNLRYKILQTVVLCVTRKAAGTAEKPAADKFSFVTSRLRWYKPQANICIPYRSAIA